MYPHLSERFGRRRVPADYVDFISPIVEITTGKVNVSLVERADYADHSLLSEVNLRNQRFPTTNYAINEAFLYNRTDKICVIRGNLTPAKLMGTR